MRELETTGTPLHSVEIGLDRLGSDRWLYYRAYVARGFAGLENFVVSTLPLVVAKGGFDRWFFLRFRDEGGLHVRLRLRTVDSCNTELLARSIEPILVRGLAATRSAPPSTYRPAIRPSRLTGRPLWGPDANDVQLKRTPYEPELDKFGQDGLPVAEEIFDVSSGVALTVLSAEASGGPSRKILAPALMLEVRRAFGGLSRGDTFWADYAHYWLDRIEVDAVPWMERFAGKSRSLAQANVPVVDLQALSSPAAATVALWQEALAVAAGRFSMAGQASPSRLRDLAFHFMHLMNNRIGLQPIEEAYFATLLGMGWS